MNVLDWILVAIRWGHALAAVAWVGGGMFYLLALRPAMRRSPVPPQATRSIGAEFRGLVHTAIAVLLLTGIILSVSRLTQEAATVPYMAVLALKVSLALYMFYVVRFLRRGAYPEEASQPEGLWTRMRRSLTGGPAILAAGVIVFGLSDVLDLIFESGL